MNLFAGVFAELLSIVHINKMILETTQMLSTALHQRAGGFSAEAPYKPYSPRNPWPVWCARRRRHFHYARRLALRYCKIFFEYNRHEHGNRRHACEAKLRAMRRVPPRAPGVKAPSYANADQAFGRLRHRGRLLRIPLTVDPPCLDADAARANRAHLLLKYRDPRKKFQRDPYISEIIAVLQAVQDSCPANVWERAALARPLRRRLAALRRRTKPVKSKTAKRSRKRLPHTAPQKRTPT